MNLKEHYKTLLSEKLIKIDRSTHDPKGKKFYKKDLPPVKEKPQIKPLYTGDKIKTLPRPLTPSNKKKSPFSSFTEKNREKLL